MSHNRATIANEIARLSALALLHRAAAQTGQPFQYGEHTYAGTAESHVQYARNLERAAENLNRELAKLEAQP